jgi:AcrR family transcriptional regulator
MYDDIISRIDPDKRSRIINASIEEFAEYSYEKASTNNIVKKAGISKGLLFHYFGSKKDLYDTMVVFVIHTLYDEIVTKINWDEPDLFERIKQLAVIKLAYSQMYPHMFDFMLQTLTYKKAGNTEKIFLCQVGTKKILRIYKPFIGGQPPVNGLRFLYALLPFFVRRFLYAASNASIIGVTGSSLSGLDRYSNRMPFSRNFRSNLMKE